MEINILKIRDNTNSLIFRLFFIINVTGNLPSIIRRGKNV